MINDACITSQEKQDTTSRWLFVSIGFALFTMFFGSGNLVFPILVGQESEGHYMLGTLGILLTGVVVPFLGTIGMMLHKGDIYSFFSCFGKRGTFLLCFLILGLMGPFGVVARCLIVAHGALTLVLPGVSLPIASAVMCLTIFILTVNKSKIVPMLGSFLTPFLLGSVALIAFFGIKNGSFPVDVGAASANGWKALTNGYLRGFQLMDLLAAFFFSQFVISHLNDALPKNTSSKSMLTLFFKSSLVGAGLLSIVYCSLVLLGWIYSPILTNVPAQEMLGTIAIESLGVIAAPCICIAIVLACITTAMVLASLFADFLNDEIAANKLGTPLALGLTLAIAFVVSTLDFQGIMGFLAPVLEAIYPALIVLTIVNIACKLIDIRSSHWPFTITLLAKLLY